MVRTETEAHSITDLHLGNILLTFEDDHPSVLEDYVKRQPDCPMARKIKDGRTIYLSNNNFGSLRPLAMLPRIADFGLAQPGDHSIPYTHPIQLALFIAPEVI